jgi:hypothetical protein
MKRIISLLLASACACLGTTVYYIEPGKTSFGSGRGVLPSLLTVTLTGAPDSQKRIFNYFDFAGNLNISLPPGVSGVCSGAPCHIFTTQAESASHYAPGSHQLATNENGLSLYWVDPIFSATTSRTGSVSLLANAPAPIPNESFAPGPYETDIKFRSAQNGYILGIRYYRVAADTDPAPLGTLYSDSGVSLASKTFTGVSGTGWQTMYFDTPVAINAGVWYRASKFDTVGSPYRDNFYQNYSSWSGPLESAATYRGVSGTCDSRDGWPQTPTDLGDGSMASSAGIIGCADIRPDGTLAGAYSPANGFNSGEIGYSRWGNVEGCQCMVGGVGPGPYALINTKIEGSGNEWHHDDLGGTWAMRGDYYYYRDTFTSPTYTWLGSPDSDGNRYFSRQKLEWKGGHRIYIGGSVFENAWNDSVNSSLAISFSNLTIGVHDINFENNEVRHTPGVFNAATAYGTNTFTIAPPPARERIANNLIWDIGPYSVKYASAGDAWFIQGASGAEDLIIDHNTILPMRGQESVLFWLYNTRSEGVTITNNILPISSAYQGISGEHSCPQRNGEAAINCLWANYTFKNNLLYPASWSVFDSLGINKSSQTNQTYASNTQPSDIRLWYPNISQSNYVPAWTDLNNTKWFKLNSFPADSAYSATPGDFHLRSDSPYISGGQYKGTDGKDVGIDVQAFESAQGKVTLIGTPTDKITASSAMVAFVAPDAQACPVDYKVYDVNDPKLINGFTRVSDTGTDPTRGVQIGGLSSKTTYMYRVNCAVEQPTGQFRTN